MRVAAHRKCLLEATVPGPPGPPFLTFTTSVVPSPRPPARPDVTSTRGLQSPLAGVLPPGLHLVPAASHSASHSASLRRSSAARPARPRTIDGDREERHGERFGQLSTALNLAALQRNSSDLSRLADPDGDRAACRRAVGGEHLAGDNPPVRGLPAGLDFGSVPLGAPWRGRLQQRRLDLVGGGLLGLRLPGERGVGPSFPRRAPRTGLRPGRRPAARPAGRSRAGPTSAAPDCGLAAGRTAACRATCSGAVPVTGA